MDVSGGLGRRWLTHLVGYQNHDSVQEWKRTGCRQGVAEQLHRGRPVFVHLCCHQIRGITLRNVLRSDRHDSVQQILVRLNSTEVHAKGVCEAVATFVAQWNDTQFLVI